jgi:hypothetical protein
VTDEPNELPQLKQGVAVYHIVGESDFVAKRMHALHALVKKDTVGVGKAIPANEKDRIDLGLAS